MRNCPECQSPMEPTKRTFAEVDVCKQCGGTFLDAGEGMSAYGPDAEMKFLVEDGRARRLHNSRRQCPSKHGVMMSYQIRAKDAIVEIDVCEECGGYFFDAGEGETLAALDKAPPGTFAPPPRQSAEDFAIAEARQKGQGFLARFVIDFLTARVEKKEER